jgi:hypothetical protein
MLTILKATLMEICTVSGSSIKKVEPKFIFNAR